MSDDCLCHEKSKINPVSCNDCTSSIIHKGRTSIYTVIFVNSHPHINPFKNTS